MNVKSSNEFTGKARYTLGDSDVAAKRLNLVNEMFKESSTRLLERNVNTHPELAIDLGCGPGNTTNLIYEITRPKKIIGIDVSESYVNRASRDWPFTFIQQDVNKVPFPDAPADLIFSRFLLSHLADPIDALKNWCTQLSTNGVLLCEEDEWADTNNDTIRTYQKLLHELVAFNKGNLYIGKILADLDSDFNVIHNKITVVSPPISLAAYAFSLNLGVWSKEKYIQDNYSEQFIRDLDKDLKRLSENPGDARVEWGLRQVVIKGDN